MREHEDIFMRQIEQMARALGALLAKLLGIKSQGDVSFEVKKVEEDMGRLLGMDIDALLTLPDEDFINQIRKTIKNYEQFYQLAEIIYEIAPYKERPESYYEKSISLAEHAMSETKTYSLRQMQKVAEIKQKLILYGT